MRVLEPRDAFLSDYEVLQHLSKLERQYKWDAESIAEMSADKKKFKKFRPYNNPALQGITRDTLAYLKQSKYSISEEEEQLLPEQRPPAPLCNLNDNKFTDLVTRLNEFDLFQAEKLQIVNQMPVQIVHLYSIVEECDTRFSEEQIEQILALVAEFI
ncbi:DNA-directed RNA polymerase III subunit RPC9 [Nakaseomyces bracarensis]|uniref:DNA-directed RNA polymerase III subunit RPC9 n=1 Tax=Nakaseomyces bracarensis TaxID=273131 RepID=A0ABR4NSP1_9SACH